MADIEMYREDFFFFHLSKDNGAATLLRCFGARLNGQDGTRSWLQYSTNLLTTNEVNLLTTSMGARG